MDSSLPAPQSAPEAPSPPADAQPVATSVDVPATEVPPQETEILQLSDDDIEVDVSSDSSASSDSDDSDDSDSDSDSDADNQSVKSDDDEDQINGPIASKHEVLDEQAPSLPDDYKIGEDAAIELIGEIKGVFDGNIIVNGSVSGEFRVLKESSVLCLEDKTVLGPLFEIFGRLQAPVYRIKYNDHAKAESFREFIGHKVFYVVPESEFVLTDSIKALKATDASNCHDEELPEEEQEFSDDEQELQAKQSKKKKRKAKDTNPPKKKVQEAPVFQPYGYAANRLPSPQPQQSAPQYQSPYGQPYNPQYAQPAIPSYIPTSNAPYNQPPAYTPGYQPEAPYGQTYPAFNSVAHNQPQFTNAYQPQQSYNAYNNTQPNFQNSGLANTSQPQQAFNGNAYGSSPAPVNVQQNSSQPIDPTKQLDNLSPEQLQQLKQMLINQLNQQSTNEPK